MGWKEAQGSINIKASLLAQGLLLKVRASKFYLWVAQRGQMKLNYRWVKKY